jgi:hypothetical protein
MNLILSEILNFHVVSAKRSNCWHVTPYSLVEIYLVLEEHTSSDIMVEEYTDEACFLLTRLMFRNLKMEVISSSETLLNFYQITWRHILEDNTART